MIAGWAERRTALPRALDRCIDSLLGAVIRGGEGLGGATENVVRVLRFLRGLHAFEARADDVFVASYPRSGTTLSQFLVYLLLWGEDDVGGAAHISQLTPWFERELAQGRIDAAKLAQLPSPRIFKTHLPYRWLPARGRCIYLTRDPADVVLSYYHLYRDYLGFDGDFEAFFQRFRRGDVQYGSLFKHRRGWLHERENPRVLFVSYEELTRDREATARRILAFLGTPCDSERLKRAVRATDFAAMKRREALFDHATDLLLTHGVRPGRFLRRGLRGQGRQILGPQQSHQLETARRQRLLWPQLELRLTRFLR